MNRPPKSILDKTFIYRDSSHTDVKATFARIRRRLELEQRRNATVVPIKREARNGNG